MRLKKIKEVHLSVWSQFLSFVCNEQQIIETSYNFGWIGFRPK